MSIIVASNSWLFVVFLINLIDASGKSIKSLSSKFLLETKRRTCILSKPSYLISPNTFVLSSHHPKSSFFTSSGKEASLHLKKEKSNTKIDSKNDSLCIKFPTLIQERLHQEWNTSDPLDWPVKHWASELVEELRKYKNLAPTLRQANLIFKYFQSMSNSGVHSAEFLDMLFRIKQLALLLPEAVVEHINESNEPFESKRKILANKKSVCGISDIEFEKVLDQLMEVAPITMSHASMLRSAIAYIYTKNLEKPWSFKQLEQPLDASIFRGIELLMTYILNAPKEELALMKQWLAKNNGVRFLVFVNNVMLKDLLLNQTINKNESKQTVVMKARFIQQAIHNVLDK